MSSQRKQQRAHRAEVQRVRAEMLGVRRELEQAYNEFDNITDPLLMEACIYQRAARKVQLRRARSEKSDTIGWFLMSQTLTDILVVIAAVFLVWLVIRLFRKPIRWILKLLLNTAIGFAALFLLNFFGSAIGITLGLNWINALVIGVAGFPGLVLLLLIKYLF